MGYAKIKNLYSDKTVLAFRQVYCLEKVHGSSAHIGWKKGQISYFAGGEKHERFVALFPGLEERLRVKDFDATIYGEVYGGRCQGMRETYGEELRFVAFDVCIGESWLSVPAAADFCASVLIPFVHYVLVDSDLANLDRERDAPSVQSQRNGILEPKIREGIVIRPPFEVTLNNGSRVCAKHKRDEFRETATPRIVSDEQVKMIADAERVAAEYVVPMRLEHVLCKMPGAGIEQTGKVILAMVEDVRAEEGSSIIWSDLVSKAIGKRTAKLFKEKLHVG